MKILLTGSSGFIGSALRPRLEASGHQVVGLVRTGSEPAPGSAGWHVASGRIDPRALEGADAVIHLAGENIGSGRWTKAKKKRLHDSRVEATRKLSETLATATDKPGALLASSAIGFYGHRGDELVDETSPVGGGFLAELCRDWEAATDPAATAGVRVVKIRTGVVLGRGGPLEKMLLPFKLGLGGIIGNGEQFFSWISLPDMVSVFELALAQDELRGPVNAVSSSPVTNRTFTKTLGKVLSRPTIFPMPALMARVLFGEMAPEVILASTRVQPARLEQCGFRFEHPMLEGALRHVLSR